MLDDKLSKDLKEAIKAAEKIHTLVEKIYYSDDLSIFFKRPFITMLATGADFLLSNLRVMLITYTAKLEKKGSE